MEKTFADCPLLHVSADPRMRTKCAEKTFAEGSNTAKFVKAFARKSFQLYGIWKVSQGLFIG